ncbi:MAG: hypothetical protein GMKNLPBB_00578 [Myxococcota bacterium]|nr:hypothetical protein [Myxococcota bacterium]
MKFGIGLRREHFGEIMDIRRNRLDFLEILSDNYMFRGGRPRTVLRQVLQRWPVAAHGVGLNIGGLDDLDREYLDLLRELFREVQPPWFSDHLCYSGAHGEQYFDLIPMPFTREAARRVAERARQAQDHVGLPLLLENPSYYFVMPGAEMTEAEFIREVLEQSGCGLLLDINNVYVNAVNHGYGAREFILSMPLERVKQVHVAGHDASGPFIVDTHGDHAVDAVYDLLAWTAPKIPDAWVLYEWDNSVPPLDVLLKEADKMRKAAESGLCANPGEAA